LYRAPNIIRAIKSRKLSPFKILTGKPIGKKLL
jgi:hypothetical protein